MTVVCKMCGAEFETSGHWAKFCPECRKRKQQDYNRRRYLEEKHDAEVAERYAAAEKQRKDMNEVLAKADAAGLSYGQYVAEKERKKSMNEKNEAAPAPKPKADKPAEYTAVLEVLPDPLTDRDMRVLRELITQTLRALAGAEGEHVADDHALGTAIGMLTAAELLLGGCEP